MRILKFENKNDLEILCAKARPATHGEELGSLISQMLESMRKADGIGLAAPQAGVSKRLFIVELERGEPIIFINPEIVSTSEELSAHEEGCLSLPGLYEKVKRPAHIAIQAYNEKWRPFTMEAEGLAAVCIQHEYDHLDGRLFIDRLDEASRNKALKKYGKLVAAHRSQ